MSPPCICFHVVRLTIVDLALQVLDDVIMTRWKVLPRDQCLGELRSQDMSLIHQFNRPRYSKFCCQLHYRKFQVRREAQK